MKKIALIIVSLLVVSGTAYALTAADVTNLEGIHKRAVNIQVYAGNLSGEVLPEDRVAMESHAAAIESIAAGYLASPSPTETPTPTTPPPTGSVTIAAAGDIATGGGGDTQTSNLVLSLNPDQVYTLGDNVYPSGTGSPAPYQNLYAPTWGRFLAKTYPTVGNHDYYSGGPGGYLAYFGEPLQYSHTAGEWLVIHLDSQGPSTTALNFLRNTLNASDAACEIVMWHHPRYSSGDHGNDTKQTSIWNEAQAQNVELVLNGHEHSYERFAPKGTTVEVVAGLGGVGTRGFGAAQPGSLVRFTGSANWGVFVADLSSGGYDARFVNVSGVVKDSFSGACV
jgi:hypothetical protein